ncbi:peptide ABC transporter [Candidatus Poribacteria bacterium]|jgi:peptide/nickel transport system permease protein|nr:peptide ABC transporter [Candidatus Poribacteria bacterium]MBR55699.1 peptide ABC transporter [Candidatus Poribacteria bacterium]MEE2910052.1 ABC transporter permease [Candidatus Poribacteria bacterium]|tara:strand:- start:672 stop:1529 length:858 start_codon:yes stop_codon:yes gene_type:complete
MKIITELFKFHLAFRIGITILIGILLLVLLSFVSPYEASERRVTPKNLAPSLEHLLGTTALGQDVFWLLTFSIRNSLIIAGLAVLIGRSMAVLIGSLSGYLGGVIDRVLQSIVDSFIVIPRLPLLILISVIIKGGLGVWGLAILLGFLDIFWPSKRYRSQILTLREREFTHTAVFSGMNTFSVILKEHFPFFIPYLLADAVSGFLWAIGMEITLAILGLCDLTRPTIGTMIYWGNYYQALLSQRLWVLAAPVISSIFIVVAFYLISESLSEYLDPRTRLKRLGVN